MSETATTLLEQLMKLSEAERLMIAERLFESLSDEKQQEAIDETLNDPEFQEELQRRLDSVADGTAELLAPEEVFAQVREHLQRKRQS
jgi:putative addiction module component (TIGR02574 family)